jgi:membrane-associated phospholipid phosphatase
MLLWAGLLALVLGVAAFAVDRRAVHVFHDHIPARWFRRIRRTTDYAKGARWLAISIALIAAAWLARRTLGDGPAWRMVFRASLAFLASLAVGSAVLRGIKIVLGRRRPRDELEHSLYGFLPWRFDFQYDSFPSGHAMTICCVAVILSAVLPAAAPLWFALALYLALTRALLNAHFLSDVFIGAGIGLLASRETVLLAFPDLARPWF